MLTKVPQPSYKRFIRFSLKAALAVEGVGLLASYCIWSKLNTDRDFRLYMFKNHNWALEGYYGLGEKFAGLNTRDTDLSIWTNEGKI